MVLHPRLLQPPVLPLVLPMLLLPLELHPRLLEPPVLRLVLSTLLLPLGLSQDPLRRLVPHAPLVLPRLLPLQPLCSAKGYMVKGYSEVVQAAYLAPPGLIASYCATLASWVRPGFLQRSASDGEMMQWAIDWRVTYSQ